MSDDANAAAGNAAGDNAAVDDKKPPAGDAGAADNTLLNGADPGADGADAGSGDAPPSWREDWRETLAAGDEKELARLKRFSTPENFAKSYRELQKKLSSGQTAGPPEGATEAEIAQFRKTAGIPEKAEDYGLAFPEGIKPTEANTALLADFAEHAHGAHLTPTAAKASADWYMKKMVEAQEARAEFVRDADADTRAELRGEWGRRDFDRNLKIRDEILDKYMGDRAPALAGVLLADGRTLGKLADFNRLLVAVGLATIDPDAVIAGDGGGGGKSLDEEWAELTNKAQRTPAEERRALQIAEARVARDERAGRGRAA